MPETKSETRTLHFSITGRIITQIAREKLYVNNDLPGAFEAIMGATLTDQLTEAQRACIALAILDGRKEIVGTYPGDDYGIEDVPEDKRPNWNLAGHFRKMNEKMAELERKNKLLLDKLACVSETIGSENLLKRCDAEWRTNWCDKDVSAEDRTIFGTEAAWGGIAAAVGDVVARSDLFRGRLLFRMLKPDLPENSLSALLERVGAYGLTDSLLKRYTVSVLPYAHAAIGCPCPDSLRIAAGNPGPKEKAVTAK